MRHLIMNRIRTGTLVGLILIITLTGSGFTAMECSKEQKKAVTDTTLSGMIVILDRSTNPFVKDIAAAARGYQADPSENSYRRAVSAIDAVLANHTLSPTVLDLANMARNIFKAFAPSSVATMEAVDEKPARKELERRFKELDRQVQRVNDEPVVP